MSSRQLQVVLDLDTSNYSGRLTTAGSQMRTFGGQVKETASQVDTFGHSLDKSGQMAGSSLAHLRDYVLTIAGIESIVESFGHKIVGVMEEAISMSAELERQTLLMKGMSTAIGDAAKMQDARTDMAALFEMSKNTGYSVQDLANSFVRLKSTGIDPMKGTLQETTDAVAAFGGNSNTMQHVALALQEMADKGTLSLKELRRQFAIFVPDGMRTMANVLGMTMDEMVKKISQGAIAARPAMELMMRQLGVAHAGAAEQMSQTLVGEMNTFKTNMIQMAAAFTGEAAGMSDSLYGTIKSLMKEINTALQSNEGKAAFHEIGQDIAEIVRGLADLVRFLVEYRSVIVAFGEAVATAFALKLIRAWGTDVVAMFANLGTASRAWLNAEKTDVPTATQVRQDYNLSLVQGVRANQDLLDATAQRASAEAGAAQIEEDAARIQRANAANALQDARQQVEALRLQQEARLRLVQTMEVEQAAALEQLQTGRMVTGQFVSRAQAMAEFQAATGRLATAEAMLARSDSELATAESTLISRTGELTASESLLATAAENASNAFIRETDTAEAAATAVTLTERAAAAGAVAVEGLGAAIKFALGPWGLLIAMAYQAASAMGVFETAADKASAAADRMANHFAKAGDAATVAADKARTIANIQNLQNSFGGVSFHKGEGVLDSGLTLTGLPGILGGETKEQAISKLQQHLKDLETGQKTAFQDHFKQLTDDQTTAATNYIESFKKRMYAVDQKQWQSLAELQKSNPKEAAAQAQRLTDAEDARVRGAERDQINNLGQLIEKNKGNKNAVEALRQAQGALVQTFDMTSTAQLRQQAMQGDASKGAAKAANAIKHLGEQAAVAQAKAAGMGAELAKVNYDIAHGIGAYKDMSAAQQAAARGYAMAIDAAHSAEKSAATDKSFDNRIAQTAGQLASLKSKLADGGLTKELSKFNAELAAGLFKGVDPARIEAMKKLLGDIDDTNHNIAVKGFGDKLSTDLTKATTQAKELWDSYGKGTLDADKKGDDLEGTLEGQLATLHLQGKAYDDMLATIHQIVQATKDGQAAIEANRITKEADKINSGLGGGSKMDVARAQLNQEIQLEYRRVVISKEGTDARKRELDAFYKWRSAKEKQFNQENQSAIVQQAKQWSQLGENLQQAYASIAGSFVDMLSSGKVDVKQFAVDILKEIAKVILEALIAYAILSAIGMTPTGANGQKMNFGQYMSSGISSSLGGGAASGVSWTPKHHNGGIIGQDSGLGGLYPNSLWNDAMRYHTGGIIGLQPNEVPIIGLKGERVLTEDEQKQMAAQGNATPPPVTVNVVNNGSDQMKPDVSTHWNGKEMIVNVVLEAASKQGPMRDMLTSLAAKK